MMGDDKEEIQWEDIPEYQKQILVEWAKLPDEQREMLVQWANLLVSMHTIGVFGKMVARLLYGFGWIALGLVAWKHHALPSFNWPSPPQ